jgi:O-antigen/teichoic acid export membrane protein
MIYISIDNDYHASLALSIIEDCQIPLAEVKFISTISVRNTIIGTSGFNFQSVEGHPLSAGNYYKNPLTYVKSIAHQFKIKNLFNFTRNDLLIIITEYQLNNALFAEEMRQAGGRSYMFDEGIGFYFNNSPYHKSKVKRIDRFYLALYNSAFKLMRIPAYARKGQEGRMFACIKDTLVDRIYSSMNFPISRKIQIENYRSVMKSVTNSSELKQEVAIFFATNFESFNLEKEEMHLAAQAIEQMSNQFSEVYIKIHPSDYFSKNAAFDFYTSLQYDNVKLIDNSLSAIQAINIYRPAVVAGSMSSTLFDALLLGCQPVFLFHLLPAIINFGVFKFTLSNLNYNFISSISEITPSYVCKVDADNLQNKGDLSGHLHNQFNTTQLVALTETTPPEEIVIASGSKAEKIVPASLVLIVLGRAAQFILALATLRVVTMLLPPSELGRLAMFTSSISFFALFLVNPIGMFINRRLHAWEAQGSIRRYLNYYWGYLLVIAVLAFFVLTVMNDLRVINLQTSAAWLMVLVCGSLLLNTANQTIIPSLNLLGFQGWFIGLTLATLASGFLIATALIYHVQPRVEYWLLGLLIGQVIFVYIGSKVLFTKLRTPQTPRPGRLTRAHIGRLFEYAWPISIAVGMSWVQSQSYRFIMADYMGLPALGLFVVGYGISAGLIAGFESVLTTYLQPMFYKLVSHENSKKKKQAWDNYASTILPALVLLICFIITMAPELTRVLLGDNYQSSAQYIVWGAMAETIRVASGVYAMAAHAQMKTRLLLIPNLIGALMVVVLLIWLTPQLGASGVGIALLLSGLAMILALHFTIHKEMKLSLPYARLFQGAMMGGLLIAGTTLIKLVPSLNNYMIASILSLSVLSVFFIALQYLLLRDVLLKRGVM